jgi:hypothetical protein
MRRFSIRAIMAVVVVCAVGLAALINANNWWTGIIPLVSLASVGVAVLGAVILSGRARYWWLGYSLFSGVYLMLTVGPGISMDVTHSLVTTRMIIDFHTRLADAELKAFKQQQAKQAAQSPVTLGQQNDDPGDVGAQKKAQKKMIAEQQKQMSQAMSRAINYVPSLRIGHSLFAMLSGLLGSTVAAWFYTMRERAEVAAREVQA